MTNLHRVRDGLASVLTVAWLVALMLYTVLGVLGAFD
jgi:hypothetical protein